MRPVCRETRDILAALPGSTSLSDACARAGRVAGRAYDLEALRSRLKKHKECCGALPPSAFVVGVGSWRAAPVGGLDYEEDVDTDVRDTAPAPAPCRQWVDRCSEPPPHPVHGVAGVVGLVPDLHCPNHDPLALEAAIRALALAFAPFPVEMRELVQLGDLIDHDSISPHERRRAARHSHEEEVESAREVLLELTQRLAVARRRVVFGNHCAWFERRKLGKVPEFANYLHLHELLGLADMGWEWTKYMDGIKIGRTKVQHDFGKSGADAPLKSLSSVGVSKVGGHTHAMGVHCAGGDEDTFRVSAHLGWLGRIDTIDYASRTHCLENWCHGVGVGYVDTRGLMWLVPIPIVDGTCVVNGVFVDARRPLAA